MRLIVRIHSPVGGLEEVFQVEAYGIMVLLRYVGEEATAEYHDVTVRKPESRAIDEHEVPQ